MNKKIVILFIFVTIFLLISSSTALPNSESEIVIQKITRIQKIKNIINNLNGKNYNLKTKNLGIIDSILNLLFKLRILSFILRRIVNIIISLASFVICIPAGGIWALIGAIFLAIALIFNYSPLLVGGIMIVQGITIMSIPLLLLLGYKLTDIFGLT